MSRLIRNGCNMTGHKMTWSVKYVLICRISISPIRPIGRLDLKFSEEGMEMLEIFAYHTVVHFTDQNRISNTVYCIR